MKPTRSDILNTFPKPVRIPVIGLCIKCGKRVTDSTKSICFGCYSKMIKKELRRQ